MNWQTMNNTLNATVLSLAFNDFTGSLYAGSTLFVSRWINSQWIQPYGTGTIPRGRVDAMAMHAGLITAGFYNSSSGLTTVMTGAEPIWFRVGDSLAGNIYAMAVYESIGGILFIGGKWVQNNTMCVAYWNGSQYLQASPITVGLETFRVIAYDQRRNVVYAGGSFVYKVAKFDGALTSPPTPAPETAADANVSSSVGIGAGSIVAAIVVPLLFVIIIAVIVVVILLMKRRRSRSRSEANDTTTTTVAMTATSTVDANRRLPAMSSLQNMTSGNTRSTAASVLLDLPRDELIAGSELTILQEIGRGSSGMVYKAMWRGVDVAVKQLRSEQLSEKEMRDFVAEILMMKSLRPHGELMQKEEEEVRNIVRSFFISLIYFRKCGVVDGSL
jgi:hypothetical protein